MDDTCAVWGTALFVVTVAVCAAIGAELAGVVTGVTAADEGVFTATGALAGCTAAIGALFVSGLLLLPFAISVAIATSVSCMPFNVDCTAVSCDGVSVEFTTTEAFNCERVAASVLKVVLNALICMAESPVIAVAPCAPIPAMDVGVALGVPASADATIPFCISKLTNVAWAT
jgi:hypothetical protein